MSSALACSSRQIMRFHMARIYCCHRPHRVASGPASGRSNLHGGCGCSLVRVNAIIPPLAVDGPLLSIRRFGTDRPRCPRITGRPAVAFGGHDVSRGVRRARQILAPCSGGTGAGKTTLLLLSAHSSRRRERIVTHRGCRRVAQAAASGAAGDARRTLKEQGIVRQQQCPLTRCVCGRPASSWARCAATRRSTCCKP